MEAIYQVIQTLINRALECQLIEKADEVYSRNQVLSLLQLGAFPDAALQGGGESIPDLLEEIEAYAVRQQLIGELDAEKEIFLSKIMNVFIQRPSEVNAKFYQLYQQDPQLATNYFYELSQNSNYIQTKAIARNMSYRMETIYGNLDITINLSKPEKDPKQIALERARKQDVQYPQCLLCVENEGYAGRIGHPARSNHRMIRMELGGEPWMLQYSPYVYYDEHCIVLSESHRDMKITGAAFARLLEFVEKFPHYFVGSNADLPIVGGSILSHDHYQGGRYEFAMAKAEEDFAFGLSQYPDVHAATVNWPMTVIRLRGKDRTQLVAAGEMILQKWRHYSDERVEVRAFTDDIPHNTITPIARMRGSEFELDLVLRNNRSSEDHPLGIFHPHHDVHHIKKENIGLIEVMGLAVLPARLKEELEEVEAFLLGKSQTVKDYHQDWADELRDKYGNQLTAQKVGGILQKELALKFQRVLEDAGVFKRTEEGKWAFERFCKFCQ